jgi:hypothetical protein
MIKRWMYRSVSNAQLSPALGALLMVIALGVTVYIYHRLIIQTLIYMLIACGLIAAVVACVALGVSSFRYGRKRRQRTRAAIVGALEAEGEDTTGMTFGALDGAPPIPPRDRTQMETAADVLADEGVELSWSQDGKTLRAKKD